MPMSAVRDKICAIAKEYAGTGATHNPDKYLELLAGDVEPEATRKGMLYMSSCALFARGVLRKAGCQSELLSKPYRIGNAVSDLFAIAYGKNAWVKADPTLVPKPGDIFVIFNADNGSDAHVGTIVSVVGKSSVDGSVTLGTCEGGQGNRGAESGAFVRKWEVRNGLYYMGARRVRGWLDADRLGIELPEPPPPVVPVPVPATEAAAELAQSVVPKPAQATAAVVASVGALAYLANLLHHC